MSPLGPFHVGALAVFMVFTYLIIKLLVNPGQERSDGNSHADSTPVDERLETLIQQAEKLEHRVGNLEEILGEEKKEQAP